MEKFDGKEGNLSDIQSTTLFTQKPLVIIYFLISTAIKYWNLRVVFVPTLDGLPTTFAISFLLKGILPFSVGRAAVGVLEIEFPV